MDWHEAARFLAQCIAFAEQDQSVSPIERATLVRSYAQQGKGFVEQAVELGYRYIVDPSQTEQGFQQLKQVLEAKAEPP